MNELEKFINSLTDNNEIELINSAIKEHGKDITSCFNKPWKECITYNTVDNKITILFWYNTKDNSTHCQKKEI